MQREYREVLLPFTQFSSPPPPPRGCILHNYSTISTGKNVCVQFCVTGARTTTSLDTKLSYVFSQCNLFLHDYKAETKLLNRLVLVFGRQSLYSLCCGKTNLGSHVRLRKSHDAHVNKAGGDNWLCDLSQDNPFQNLPS